MVLFLRQLFTWWNGATLATRLMTWRRGRFAGEDTEGNRYYQSADGTRRWVIYNGTAEASRVPAEWHGWLHHTVSAPPTEAPPAVKPWELPHRANMTGTAAAWRPSGSLKAQGARAHATGDYEAWTPE